MKINVVIVEDDLLMAQMLEESLELDGYNVCGIATSVAQSKALAIMHRPDYAIIDLRLSNGDLGTDFAEFLRETGDTGIMFSTGNPLVLSSNIGDAVMSKPYRLRDVAIGLKIMGEIRWKGKTNIPMPRNFQMLSSIPSNIIGNS